MSGALGTKLFLSQLRTLLEKGRVQFKLRNRTKTVCFLLDHGWTSEDAFEVIKLLEEKHYHRGPDTDRDGSEGSIMIFVYPHEDLGIDLYIKLKIWTNPDTGDLGAVLSFHEEGMHND